MPHSHSSMLNLGSAAVVWNIFSSVCSWKACSMEKTCQAWYVCRLGGDSALRNVCMFCVLSQNRCGKALYELEKGEVNTSSFHFICEIFVGKY